MRPGSIRSWSTHLAGTFLLSLVLAYIAGLLPLAVSAGLDQAVSPRAVALAFGLTLIALVAEFRHPPDEALQPAEASGSEGPSGRWVVLALLAGAAATAFFTTYPQIDRISEQIIGNTGDSGLNIYLLEWQLHAATRDPGSYFDLNIFAPERFTLFWGPSLIPLVPLYALLKLCGGIIPAFNLLMVLTSFATLIATYYFTRTAGFDPLGSAVGAVMFSTTGQRMSHLGHLDSIQTLWIPVFAALLLKSWQLNRVRHGLLLGLALGCCLMSAPYYFLAGLGFIGVLVVIQLAAQRKLPWKSLAPAAAITLTIGGPILVLSRLAGVDRSPDELFPINWSDFYHPGAFTPAMEWLASAAGAAGGGESLENWLFSSIIMVLLAAFGAWTWLRARQAGRNCLPPGGPDVLVHLLAAGAVSGVLMSIGPYFRLFGLTIPLPMLAVMKLPGFDGARVTGRFIAPAFLSLTVVALVGLGALASRMRGFGRPAFFVAFAAAVLLTTHTVYPSVGLDIAGPPSQVNRVLATRPLGLVAELPWPGCPGLGCLFTEPPRMIWSTYDWYPGWVVIRGTSRTTGLKHTPRWPRSRVSPPLSFSTATTPATSSSG